LGITVCQYLLLQRTGNRDREHEPLETHDEVTRLGVLAGKRQLDLSRVSGVASPQPDDHVHQESIVLEAHELAVVQRARSTEAELDLADRRTRRRQARRLCGLSDRERRVRPVRRIALARIERDVLTWLQRRLHVTSALGDLRDEHDRAEPRGVVRILQLELRGER
jgi:hypothetical protein